MANKKLTLRVMGKAQVTDIKPIIINGKQQFSGISFALITIMRIRFAKEDENTAGVIPVKTGIQKKTNWIPAFAGMTKQGRYFLNSHYV